MRRAIWALLFSAAWLTSSSCKNVPFDPVRLVPTHQTDVGALLARMWTLRPGVYRSRQTGLLEIRGKQIPLTAFMELNANNQTVRLVGMNELGIKLFDLLISEANVEQRQMLPSLSRGPDLSEAVGGCARRIFLGPIPRESDTLSIEAIRPILLV